MGQAGTLSLAGVLSLVGVLAGDNGVQPAGTPLTLDLGGTVPPGWDALSHNRGLDVSVGAAVGFGGVGWRGRMWVLPGWWGPILSPLPLSLLSQPGSHRGFPPLLVFSSKNLIACQAGAFPWLGWGGGRAAGDGDRDGDEGFQPRWPWHSPRPTHT